MRPILLAFLLVACGPTEPPKSDTEASVADAAQDANEAGLCCIGASAASRCTASSSEWFCGPQGSDAGAIGQVTCDECAVGDSCVVDLSFTGTVESCP